jgi:hypothetical protein
MVHAVRLFKLSDTTSRSLEDSGQVDGGLCADLLVSRPVGRVGGGNLLR